MTRPPRNAKTDRLVTRKMINFSYLQIGLIQAFAGYFTYMTVLNSYGYSPWVLLNRGSAEFWGFQPMFCKFNGGSYANYFGEIDRNTDPTTERPSALYPLWVPTSGGYIMDCVYPLKNFKGTKSSQNEDAFKNPKCEGAACANPAFYTSLPGTSASGSLFTDEERQIPYQAILAAEAAGYYNYVPFASKTSPFWEDSYLWWDSADQFLQTGNLPFENPKRFFGGNVPGLFSLCQGDTAPGGANPAVTNILSTPNTESSLVRGAQKPDIPPKGKLLCPGSTAGAAAQTDVWNAEGDGTYGPIGIFCNGLCDTNNNTGTKCGTAEGAGASDCQWLNWLNPLSGANALRNPHQSFYCNDECGRFVSTDITKLPFCTNPGDPEQSACGVGISSTCNQKCVNVCYPPLISRPPGVSYTPQDTDLYKGNIATSNNNRQCTNIGSYVSNGQALKQAQGAFWGSIVLVQIAGLLCAKTRWLSLRSQGMTNSFMNFGIFFELLLVSWLAYCPPINSALGTASIRLTHWFPAIPWAIFIFIYDETRKALMRSTSPEKLDPYTGQVTRTPGWLERFTYY